MLKEILKSSLGRAIWRAFRAAVAVGLAIFLSNLANEPDLLFLAPIFLGLSKYIRDEFKVDLKVI